MQKSVDCTLPSPTQKIGILPRPTKKWRIDQLDEFYCIFTIRATNSPDKLYKFKYV